jgi:hypothetical protein
MGRADEELLPVPCEGVPIVPRNMARVRTGLEGRLLLPYALAAGRTRSRAPVRAVPDGNRGAVLPDRQVELWGRRFLVGVKGVGARVGLYEEGPLAFTGMGAIKGRVFTSESWFGENPWGALSERACAEDAAVTELCGPDSIEGFHICPVVSASPLPGWVMRGARERYWYRRLDGGGAFYQQLRLMPSNVRLYHESESTLGRSTAAMLEAFGVRDGEALDEFIENYLRSGMATLTLAARTARRAGRIWRAMDYSDVWLDKDSVVAPDGTLFFADLEGLEWVPLHTAKEAAARVRRQFDRNYYELMYGLDRLLGERGTMTGQAPSWGARRRSAAARMQLALAGDRYISLEESRAGLDAVVRPAAGPAREVTVRVLDFEEGER